MLKNLFRSILFLLALSILGQGFVASQALAQKDYGLKATVSSTGGAIPNEVAGSSDIYGLIAAVVKIALSLIGVIFFLLIFYAGVNWMTAQGNSDKIDKSKDTIQAAAVGLIIVMAAYAITNFVFDELTKVPSNGTQL